VDYCKQESQWDKAQYLLVAFFYIGLSADLLFRNKHLLFKTKLTHNEKL